jgi:leader peptidase (prepilin peptidase)/N-methyltransferase
MSADWTRPLRRRPLRVALACLAVAAPVGWRVGIRPETPAFLYLAVAGMALAVVDIALKRLPDPLTLPSYGIGAALLGAAAPFTADGTGRFLHALAGMAALWALFAVQWFVVPDAVGLGDVKLAGVLGLYLGWLGLDAWMLGTVGMFVLGGLFSAVLMGLGRLGRRSQIPYGPFMLAGTLAAILIHAP